VTAYNEIVPELLEEIERLKDRIRFDAAMLKGLMDCLPNVLQTGAKP